jgi:hypothetical protein
MRQIAKFSKFIDMDIHLWRGKHFRYEEGYRYHFGGSKTTRNFYYDLVADYSFDPDPDWFQKWCYVLYTRKPGRDSRGGKQYTRLVLREMRFIRREDKAEP